MELNLHSPIRPHGEHRDNFVLLSAPARILQIWSYLEWRRTFRKLALLIYSGKKAINLCDWGKLYLRGPAEWVLSLSKDGESAAETSRFTKKIRLLVCMKVPPKKENYVSKSRTNVSTLLNRMLVFVHTRLALLLQCVYLYEYCYMYFWTSPENNSGRCFFNIFLTVYLRIILASDQLDAQFLL